MNQLIYEKLPSDISERHVLLLDPVLGTGNFSYFYFFFFCFEVYFFLNLSTLDDILKVTLQIRR